MTTWAEAVAGIHLRMAGVSITIASALTMARLLRCLAQARTNNLTSGKNFMSGSAITMLCTATTSIMTLLANSYAPAT